MSDKNENDDRIFLVHNSHEPGLSKFEVNTQECFLRIIERKCETVISRIW